MSVTNDMKLTLKGNKDECEHFILKLVEKGYFDAVNVGGIYIYGFHIESDMEKIKKQILNKRKFDNSVYIIAAGPYGRFGLVDGLYSIFSEICKEMPTVEFEGTVDSSYDGDGSRKIVDFNYSDRKFNFEDSGYFDDDKSDMYYNYISENLPYDIFVALFKLDCEEFDSCDYSGFIFDSICYDDFFNSNYNQFKEMLPDSPLQENEYTEAINKIKEMNIITYNEFCDRIDDLVPDKEKWTKYTREI